MPLPKRRFTIGISDEEWRLFEAEVARIHTEMDTSASVSHDAKLAGRFSGALRQVDVLIEGHVAGQRLRVAVECKTNKRKLGIGEVDEFVGKLQDLDVERGVLFNTHGYTQPAVDRATGSPTPKVQLRTLRELEWNPVDVEALRNPKFGDCPNENCYTGDVQWSQFVEPAGGLLDAGQCDVCGASGVRCTACGSVIVLDDDQCCLARYASITIPGQPTWDSIVRTLDGVETVFS